MNKIVGLDIGENSVKMAYFADRELKRTAKVELPDAMVSGGRILSMDAMADFLHDAAKGSGIPLTNAALVVPASEVYTRIITLPAMTEQQLFYNLPYEFRDFLTEEKSKYFFDYAVRRIVNDETGHPKEMELFACAILKTTVEGYRAMLHRAGFRLRVLTVTECAYGAVLGAYLRRMGAENDDKDRCIVSIGHRSTHLYIYHGATFDSRREIDVGGRLIDEQIAEHCGVDIHLAHSYMRSDYNGVLEADYAREAYSRLAVEIMKAVNFYNYNNRDRELHDLYICGGGGGIEPMLRTIVETTRLTLHPVSELLSQQLSTEEPWTYLRAIGGVSEGIKGGLAWSWRRRRKRPARTRPAVRSAARRKRASTSICTKSAQARCSRCSSARCASLCLRWRSPSSASSTSTTGSPTRRARMRRRSRRTAPRRRSSRTLTRCSRNTAPIRWSGWRTARTPTSTLPWSARKCST